MKHSRILVALTVLLLVCQVSAFAEILTLPMDFSGGTPPQRKYEIGLMEYQDPSIHVTRRNDRPILPDGKESVIKLYLYIFCHIFHSKKKGKAHRFSLVRS